METKVIHEVSEHKNALHIGVLSDTHGEISQHVMKCLRGSEVILHAGDVCGQEVLDQLATISAHVIAVAGNNDQRFDYGQEKLPEVVRLTAPGGDICLVHGHQFGMHLPSHDLMREEFASSRAIIYGHSHVQIHDCDATPEVINPGAAGNTRTNGGASCATIVANSSVRWQVNLYRES